MKYAVYSAAVNPWRESNGSFKTNLKENEYYLKQVQNAVRNKIGASLPFSSEIEIYHLSEKVPTRALVLLNSASLFDKPDQAFF
ncbi:MAG: hypothetical protein CM1200mP28_07350 [Deltaproteobacteria bacterium]|nr:MAG: hypothetical protein CM1200mP28_07350 [Deltaproteobacteria bacterium]